MITADVLIGNLGKTTDDPSVRAVLLELGVPVDGPELDEGFSDYEAEEHGVVLFFRAWNYVENLETLQDDAKDSSIISDVMFWSEGLNCAQGFRGELPFGLKFSDSRAAVKERLGVPNWTSPLDIPNDRWDMGYRYLTIDFSNDESRIKKVTYGLALKI